VGRGFARSIRKPERTSGWCRVRRTPQRAARVTLPRQAGEGDWVNEDSALSAKARRYQRSESVTTELDMAVTLVHNVGVSHERFYGIELKRIPEGEITNPKHGARMARLSSLTPRVGRPRRGERLCFKPMSPTVWDAAMLWSPSAETRSLQSTAMFSLQRSSTQALDQPVLIVVKVVTWGSSWPVIIVRMGIKPCSIRRSGQTRKNHGAFPPWEPPGAGFSWGTAPAG